MDLETFAGLLVSHSLGLNVPLSGVKRSLGDFSGGFGEFSGGRKESLIRVGLSSSAQGNSSSG